MNRIARLIALTLTTATAAVAQSPSSAPGVKLPPYSEVRLKNGTHILLMEKRDVPLIALSGRIRGGSVADPEGKDGVAALTAELLRKGARRRNAQQIAEAIDGVGGDISVFPSRESINVSAEFMSRDVDLMISLLSDILRRPKFPEDEFTKVKQRAIEEIQAAKDSDPRALVGTYFDAFVFASHLAGRPAGGSESTLGRITRDDVLSYYKNHFGGDRLILAVVGDFDTKSMSSKLENAFGSWGKAAWMAPKLTAKDRSKGRRVLLVDKPGATQTYFWVGSTGLARNDPDRIVFDVANTAFGGRFTSLLNSALRINSGLTYGASSVAVRPSIPGALAMASYTKTETTEKAVDMALEVMERFKTKGLEPDMLASVKAYMLGQFPPRLETGDQLAARLAEIAFFGLDRSDVDQYGAGVASATPEALRKIVDRIYPGKDELTFVFIGDAGKIRDIVKKYGPVTEMKITEPSFAPAEAQGPRP